MKIVVVGKGGVGKTTIAATLSRLIGRDGYNVVAVDADPSLNLAIAIGIPRDVAERSPVLFDEEEFVKSRTLLPNGLYVLNPIVDDIVEKFGIRGPDNVTVIKLGEVKKGGTRCLCPEYALLRALLSHLVLGRRDIVVIDMVAGLEPMSRGAIRGVDIVLCIVEPSQKSVDVAIKIEKFAQDINVKKLEFVANKIRGDKDIEFLERSLGRRLLHAIPYDEAIMDADLRGVSPLDYKPYSEAVKALVLLKNKIISRS
ncbi:MAG: AAA family ATPase [Ignisphaera sp.]|uniref:CobQ/CobB/MinD/ParA nucleotide binding domain-containing protein n=1 Tax=Ignisphaera aggregans TaxID=334771 RepID=A0A7C4NKP3_9CREN